MMSSQACSLRFYCFVLFTVESVAITLKSHGLVFSFILSASCSKVKVYIATLKRDSVFQATLQSNAKVM